RCLRPLHRPPHRHPEHARRQGRAPARVAGRTRADARRLREHGLQRLDQRPAAAAGGEPRAGGAPRRAPRRGSRGAPLAGAGSARLTPMRHFIACWIAAITMLAGVAQAATLRIASAFDPQTMDPQALALLYHSRIAFQIYESLVSRDEKFAVEPALAVSWQQ